jgi:hypothetical protein
VYYCTEEQAYQLTNEDELWIYKNYTLIAVG